MNQEELRERIALLEQDIQQQREIVLNCIHRKPAIREARYLEELLTDLKFLQAQLDS